MKVLAFLQYSAEQSFWRVSGRRTNSGDGWLHDDLSACLLMRDGMGCVCRALSACLVLVRSFVRRPGSALHFACFSAAQCGAVQFSQDDVRPTSNVLPAGGDMEFWLQLGGGGCEVDVDVDVGGPGSESREGKGRQGAMDVVLCMQAPHAQQ